MHRSLDEGAVLRLGARGLVVQACVLERQRRLVADRLDQGCLLWRERVLLVEPRDEEGADGPAPHGDREEQARPVRKAGERLLVDPRVGGDVARPGRPALAPGVLEDPVAVKRDGVRQEAAEQGLRDPVARDRAEEPLLSVRDEGADHVGPDGPVGLPGDAPHHLGEIERRVDRAADVHERLGPPEPVLGGLVEAGVLERPGGLVREGLREVDLRRREHTALDVADAERADDPVLHDQGHHEPAPVERPLESRPDLGRQHDARVGREIRSGHGLPPAEGETDQPGPLRQDEAFAERRFERPRDRHGSHRARPRLERPDDGQLGAQENPHAERDLVRHRPGVERLAEDAPDVGNPPRGFLARTTRSGFELGHARAQ